MSLSTKASLLFPRFLLSSSLQIQTSTSPSFAAASASSSSSSATTGSGGRTHLPDLPKKPQSSFFRYLQSNRERLKATNPSLSLTSLTKLAGEKWKELPEVEKQIYKDAHHRDITDWSAKKASIEEHLAKANLLDDIKAKMAGERVDRALKKARVSKKKLAEDTGKPKNPPMAFNLFMKQSFSDRKKETDVKVTEKFKQAVEAWKQLDETARTKYVEESNRLKEKYAQELEVWSRKMEKDEGKAEEIKKAEDKLSRLRSRKRQIAVGAAAGAGGENKE